MLYGIEVWELCDADMLKVETAHDQMARNIQGLPSNVAGLAARGTLGWTSLESWADQRRLVFLFDIFTLPGDNIYREYITRRIIHLYNWNKDIMPGGPVNMIFKLSSKYGLSNILHDLCFGNVIGKSVYKRAIKKSVVGRDTDLWDINLNLYSSLKIS